MQKKNIYPFFIVLLFWIYYMQGIWYPTGDVISQIIIVVLIGVGLFSMLLSMISFRNLFVVKMWFFFFVLQLLYYLISSKYVEGIINEAIGIIPTIGMMKNIAMSTMGFCIFYYYSKKHSISKQIISIIGLVFFILSIIRFSFAENVLAQDSMREDNVNNAAYLVVAAIPFIPFIYRFNKYLGYTAIVFSIYLVIMGSKRGAVVSLFVAVTVAYIFYLVTHRFTLTRIILTTIIFVGIMFVAYYSYMSNEYLQNRIEQTETMGIGMREINYQVLWNHWKDNQSAAIILLGNGFAKTIEVCGNYAHNDWLELLTDNGLFGVAVYLLMIIYFFLFALKISDETYKLSMILFITLWVSKSVFSMGYCSMESFMYTSLAGIIVGNCSSNVQSLHTSFLRTNATYY